MTPMGQAAAAEVYVPMTLQAWRVVNWVGFFYQIILQILRGAPCLPHLLSCISSSSSPAFRPLPVAEVPLNDLSSSAHVENGVLDGRPVEKLTESDGKPKINYVTVFERPGLGEFLKRVSEFADLALFTAGLEDYAKPLVDRIDVENLFKLRLYRPSTISTGCREHVKDLSCLSKDFSRIVIVDNNPFSFLLQPLNGIPCVPFSAGQPYDDQLLEVLLPLLKRLSLQKDVRPTLQERFHMAEWFQMHGFHVCG